MRLQLISVFLAAVVTTVFFSTRQDSAQKKTEANNQVGQKVEALNLPPKVQTKSPAKPITRKVDKKATEKVDQPIKQKFANISEKKKAVGQTEEPITEGPVKVVEAASSADDTSEQVIEDKVNIQDSAATTVGALADSMRAASQTGIFGSAEVSLSTDFKTFDDDTKTTSTSFFVRPRYRLGDNYTLRANIWVDKGLSQGYEDTIRDTRVGLARNPIKLSDKLLFAPNITATLPTSERSKENEELILGTEVNGTLIYSASNFLSFIYTPRLRKNFHEFETSRTDEVNIDYSQSNIFVVSYSFADKWAAQYVLFHSQTWSYEGTRRDPSYLSIVEINYTISKSTYLTMGTITGGQLFQAERGPDQTLEIFDENTTNLYTNIGILF